MSASVIAIVPPAPEMAGERPLQKAQWSAGHALQEALRSVPRAERALELYDQLHRATDRRLRYWESRARKAERTLKAALEADVLSDEQRLAILDGLYGKQQLRDSKVLTEFEADLIRDYRRMSSVSRTAVRVVFKAIATTMAADQPEKGGA
jgi:molybdenum-dependent DNA-binding transcriptional regulator ModE